MRKRTLAKDQGSNATVKIATVDLYHVPGHPGTHGQAGRPSSIRGYAPEERHQLNTISPVIPIEFLAVAFSLGLTPCHYSSFPRFSSDLHFRSHRLTPCFVRPSPSLQSPSPQDSGLKRGSFTHAATLLEADSP